MSHDVIIATAKTQIGAHPVIGLRWHHIFTTQEEAAQSWLDYQARNPGGKITTWFAHFDNSVLSENPESRWVL